MNTPRRILSASEGPDSRGKRIRPFAGAQDPAWREFATCYAETNKPTV